MKPVIVTKKARLDADRTAVPRTAIVAHVPEGFCTGPEIAFRQAVRVEFVIR